MAKPFKVDFSNTSDGGNFYVTPGKYTVKLTNVSQEEGNAAPYIKWTFEVVGHGVTLIHRTTLKPDALFSLKNTMSALLGVAVPAGPMVINPDKLLGRICMANVADREYNGNTYSDVKKLEPYTATDVTSEAGVDDDLSDL